jgi:hypothetical protein
MDKLVTVIEASTIFEIPIKEIKNLIEKQEINSYNLSTDPSNVYIDLDELEEYLLKREKYYKNKYK